MESTRRIIVTGTNRGLGFELVKKLFNSPIKRQIIMTSRNLEAGKKAFDTIKSTNPNSESILNLEQLDVEDTKSIDSFVENIKAKYEKIDILVNNVGIATFEDGLNAVNNTAKVISGSLMKQIVTVDLLNTIYLTEKILSIISDDGKIIMISSTLGKLSLQGSKLQEVLSESSLTTEDIKNLALQFIECSKNNTHKEYGFSSSGYAVSKALLNTYVRFALGRIAKPTQQLYTLCPGWCKTDMGGDMAPLTPEQGTETTMFLIEQKYEVNQDYQSKFIRNSSVVEF